MPRPRPEPAAKRHARRRSPFLVAGLVALLVGCGTPSPAVSPTPTTAPSTAPTLPPPTVGGSPSAEPSQDAAQIYRTIEDQVVALRELKPKAPVNPTILDDAGIKKFIADYKTEYGHDPENAFAALGYDTVYLMVDAIKRAGSTDSAAVKAAIEATKDFPGITGKITFAAGSHVPQKGVTVIAVKGGKLTLGAEVVPDKVPAP